MNQHQSIHYQLPPSDASGMLRCQFRFKDIEQIYIVPAFYPRGEIYLLSGNIAIDDSDAGDKKIEKLDNLIRTQHQSIRIQGTSISNCQIVMGSGSGDIFIRQTTEDSRKYKFYSQGAIASVKISVPPNTEIIAWTGKAEVFIDESLGSSFYPISDNNASSYWKIISNSAEPSARYEQPNNFQPTIDSDDVSNLTQEQAIEEIQGMIEIIQAANISDSKDKETALQYLKFAKDEAKQNDPDRLYIAGSIKRAFRVLKNYSWLYS